MASGPHFPIMFRNRLHSALKRESMRWPIRFLTKPKQATGAEISLRSAESSWRPGRPTVSLERVQKFCHCIASNLVFGCVAGVQISLGDQEFYAVTDSRRA